MAFYYVYALETHVSKCTKIQLKKKKKHKNNDFGLHICQKNKINHFTILYTQK